MTDSEVITKAAAEKRIAVTLDLDFSRLVALQRLAQPSVVLIRLEEFTTSQLNGVLLTTLKKHRAELEAGAIVVVEPGNTRARNLPIW